MPAKRSDRSRFLTEDAALIGLAAGARSVSGQNAEVPGNVSLGTKAYERSLVGLAALTLGVMAGGPEAQDQPEPVVPEQL